MTKKRSSEFFSTKAAFFQEKVRFFPGKVRFFYKFDLGISGDFSVAGLGFSIFLELQH